MDHRENRAPLSAGQIALIALLFMLSGMIVGLFVTGYFALSGIIYISLTLSAILAFLCHGWIVALVQPRLPDGK